MPAKKIHSISVFLNQKYPSIVRSEGIYLYDDTGKRYVDASSGPIICSLGYGNEEIADVLKEQTLKAAYVFRLSLIHISEPTRPPSTSRMPSSA